MCGPEHNNTRISKEMEVLERKDYIVCNRQDGVCFSYMYIKANGCIGLLQTCVGLLQTYGLSVTHVMWI